MKTFTLFLMMLPGVVLPVRAAMPPQEAGKALLPSAATYHWCGAQGIDWTVPGNWLPDRTDPAPDDLLVFDIGGTWTITGVPVQTIGQLQVLSLTGITLQGPGALALAGDTGPDLLVEAGCHLNASGSGAVSVSLAAGTTAAIGGSVTFAGGAHRLMAASPSAITFGLGSVFKASTGFTGNPFGTTSLGSVVFEAGSTYVSMSGGNPFGATAPASVVVFQPGSLFRIDAYVVPSFGGRTYGDFEMNYPGSITATGSSAVSVGNFIATKGTFYFNVTGTPGHLIRGNISVASVATLIFSPSSAGTVTFGGTSPQAISGFGSLMAGANSSLAITNTQGVVLNMDASVNHLRIAAGGKFTIAQGRKLTVNGDLINEGAATGMVIGSDASLLHDTPGVAAVAERLIPAAGWADGSDGWHLVSAPLEGQAIDSASGFVTSGPGNDYDLYAWSEAGHAWVNHKNTTDPPLFADLNGGNQFVPGRGYLCAYSQGGEKRFSGMLNVSDIPVGGLQVTGVSAPHRGWHLLGNPFPCSITWFDGWSSANIGGVAQVWSEEGQSYTPRNPGEVIPPCNGFMVQVQAGPGGTGSLIIPAAAKLHGSQSWYKEAAYPVVRLVARDLDFPSFQECQVRLNPLSSGQFDPDFDGRFLPGHAPVFCAVQAGERLSVLSVPVQDGEIVIQLLFSRSRGTRYSIEASGCAGAGGCFLFDRLTGRRFDLAGEQAYHFTAGNGDEPARFELRISPVNPAGPPDGQANIAFRGDRLVVDHPEGARLELIDLTGRTVMQKSLPGDGVTTLVPGLPAGYYLVRLSGPGLAVVSRVILR